LAAVLLYKKEATLINNVFFRDQLVLYFRVSGYVALLSFANRLLFHHSASMRRSVSANSSASASHSNTSAAASTSAHWNIKAQYGSANGRKHFGGEIESTTFELATMAKCRWYSTRKSAFVSSIKHAWRLQIFASNGACWPHPHLTNGVHNDWLICHSQSMVAIFNFPSIPSSQPCLIDHSVLQRSSLRIAQPPGGMHVRDELRTRIRIRMATVDDDEEVTSQYQSGWEKNSNWSGKHSFDV
jgi:hypothetical protein